MGLLLKLKIRGRGCILCKDSVFLEAAMIATVVGVLIVSLEMRFEVKLNFLGSYFESVVGLVTKVLKSFVNLVMRGRGYVVM